MDVYERADRLDEIAQEILTLGCERLAEQVQYEADILRGK